MDASKCPSVSVIVPVFNEAGTIRAQLEALAAQDYKGQLEVIVGDNGSTDGSAEVAHRFAGGRLSLEVVPAHHRKGPSAARNAGLVAAGGEIVLFCDADDVADSAWVRTMAEALERCELVGGRLEVESMNDALLRAWRQPGAQTSLPHLLDFLPFAMGANMGFRADVIRALGGFDERFDRGGEEVALCWRAQLGGATLCFAPDAVVHYRFRKGLVALMRQNRNWGKASVDLFVEFRSDGAHRSSTADGASRWLQLLLSAPLQLPRERTRGIWASRAAYRWGRAAASLEHKTLFL